MSEDLRTSEMIEAVADWDHRAWSGWMRHLFSQCQPQPTGGWWMSRAVAERWQRQMNTPYAELSEPEKESDRQEARSILDVVATLQAVGWRRADACQLRHERDEARYHARVLAHAYQSDNCPPSATVRTALTYPVNPYEVVQPSDTAELEACAPQEQAVIAELAAHIQTARRALADPRTERSILSAGVALDEAFQVLEGRPPVVGFLDGGDTPQEPPRHVACHDLVCNGDKSKPRGTPMSGCSCRGREERTHGELMEALEARAVPPPFPNGPVGDLIAYGREEVGNALKVKDRNQYQFWQGWNAALEAVERFAPKADPALPQDQEAT